ncbi:MAG: rhomboid family intramembrane serine protease [Flavobacterium sp.]|nr:MAG: rhomboid family intramembrane serine protease [Flavobacterium sp.]
MNIIEDLKLQYKIGGITQRLIFWNVGLFVFPMVLFSILSLFNVGLPYLRWDIPVANDWLSLSSRPADLLWKPWSLLSYAFLHAGFFHLLFNMMVLYFSGRLFLTFFTQKQMFGLYLLAALFAGVIFIASYNLLPMLAGQGHTSKMVGASAAIMAILIASAVYAPYYQVRLLLIGTVKLWHIALVLIVLDLIQVSAENTGGHLAHLAGALFGFIYIKVLQSGTDLSMGVSAVIDFFANLFKPRKKTPFKKVHRNTSKPVNPIVKPTKDITQKQIDEILDKISKSGYDSLTKEEKEFLFKVGK